MRKNVCLMALAALTCVPLQALEIPLGGDGGSARGGSIGYVDMERIFQVFPQTVVAKEDYAKQLQKKREQLAEKGKELDAIKNRVSVLESTLKDMPQSLPVPEAPAPGAVPGEAAPAPAAPAPAGGSQALADLKKELAEKQIEYDELKKQAYEDLASYQKRQSQVILGKIYQALKEVAAEAQVQVVVDKSNILYGAGDIDLTEKLQQRVRGY